MSMEAVIVFLMLLLCPVSVDITLCGERGCEYLVARATKLPDMVR